MFIILSPKRLVHQVTADYKITHILSMLDHGDTIRTPMEILKPENHLLLNFLDTEKPQDRRGPMAEDVAEMLEWSHNLKDTDRLLVHCFAGISRSTAMALAIWVQKHGMDFEAAGTWLKTVRPVACPNRLIAFYADEILGCKGKLLKLADEVGSFHLLKNLAQEDDEDDSTEN